MFLMRSTIGVEEDCGGDPSLGDESVGTAGTVDGGVVGGTGSVDGVNCSACSVCGGDSGLAARSDFDDDDGEGTGEGTREGTGEGTGEGAGEGTDEFALTVSLKDRNSSVSVDNPLDEALL